MKNKQPKLTGKALVADFVMAVTNLSTAEMAKFMAEQSERDTIQTIEYVSGGEYANPQNIPIDTQESLVKSSLDAHIKKVQADQLSSFAADQMAQLEEEIMQNYRGKKVTVTVLDARPHPIESYWANDETGEYTTGQVKSKTIKGVVEDISLEKNLLMLKPAFFSRLFFPRRKYFAVYIVNPETLEPAVKLALR